MEVYLDNSATTRPYDDVVRVVCDTMTGNYGNPSSLHRMGKNAEDALNEARKIIASTVYGTPDEIYFTSGGTESDNMAILGYARANRRRGNKVITQKTEHAAVLESFKVLEDEGFEVVYTDVDSDGMPILSQIEDAIDDNTTLLSFMYVNNENGAVFPIEAIAAIAKAHRCALHVDAVQAYGKMDINPGRIGIDMMSISSHKIHGPNGVGALYVKKGIRLLPTVFGGKQEKGLRSGTENLAAVAGFAAAAKIKKDSMADDAECVGALKKRLTDTLVERIDNVVVNTPENSIYSIVNISFPGLKSEVLLHVLESNGIYVSTGSACNSKKNKFSYVLKAMKLKDNVIDSAVRFSLSSFNTAREIDYVCDVLCREVTLLRKIMR